MSQNLGISSNATTQFKCWQCHYKTEILYRCINGCRKLYCTTCILEEKYHECTDGRWIGKDWPRITLASWRSLSRNDVVRTLITGIKNKSRRGQGKNMTRPDRINLELQYLYNEGGVKRNELRHNLRLNGKDINNDLKYLWKKRICMINPNGFIELTEQGRNLTSLYKNEDEKFGPLFNELLKVLGLHVYGV